MEVLYASSDENAIRMAKNMLRLASGQGWATACLRDSAGGFLWGEETNEDEDDGIEEDPVDEAGRHAPPAAS